MSGEEPRDALANLDARVKKAQESARERDPETGVKQGYDSFSFAVGMRVSLEMVAALIVGGGIGWFLDRWLGTRPWLLIVFLLLGLAAGVRGAYRAAQQVAARGDTKG